MFHKCITALKRKLNNHDGDSIAEVLVALLGAKVFLQLDVVWLAWPISFVAGTVFPFIVYRRMMRGIADEEAENPEA